MKKSIYLIVMIVILSIPITSMAKTMNFTGHIRDYFVAKEAGRGPPTPKSKNLYTYAGPAIILYFHDPFLRD